MNKRKVLIFIGSVAILFLVFLYLRNLVGLRFVPVANQRQVIDTCGIYGKQYLVESDAVSDFLIYCQPTSSHTGRLKYLDVGSGKIGVSMEECTDDVQLLCAARSSTELYYFYQSDLSTGMPVHFSTWEIGKQQSSQTTILSSPTKESRFLTGSAVIAGGFLIAAFDIDYFDESAVRLMGQRLLLTVDLNLQDAEPHILVLDQFDDGLLLFPGSHLAISTYNTNVVILGYDYGSNSLVRYVFDTSDLPEIGKAEIGKSNELSSIDSVREVSGSDLILVNSGNQFRICRIDMSGDCFSEWTDSLAVGEMALEGLSAARTVNGEVRITFCRDVSSIEVLLVNGDFSNKVGQAYQNVDVYRKHNPIYQLTYNDAVVALSGVNGGQLEMYSYP